MRKHYTKVLKTFFHEKLFLRREMLGISQEEMADRLAIIVAILRNCLKMFSDFVSFIRTSAMNIYASTIICNQFYFA